MWYFLLGAIIVGFLLDVYTIWKGKPTRKSAFKGCVNHWAYLLLGFGIIFIANIVLILALVGVEILKGSSDFNARVIANGLSWGFDIAMFSFVFVAILDAFNILIRKKKSQLFSIYFNWAEKLDKEGLFKYTDDEKAYNKIQADEFKAKMHKLFPILNRKKVNDGTF
jgi:hypothetical protein